MTGRASLEGAVNRRDFLTVAVRATAAFGAFGLWVVTLRAADATTRIHRDSAFGPAFGTGFR
ncbi:MAG: hypothetical protein J4G10_05685 [Alphaproteobacteria bacterium]|nr:hypothetical protein [Alphaproteobacteria bacterium]